MTKGTARPRRPTRANMADKIADSFVQASEMEAYRSYIERGRTFRYLPAAQLEAEYLKAGNAFIREDDRTQFTRFQYLSAEYRARKENAPTSQLMGAGDKAMVRVEKFTKNDFERVKRRLDAFLAEIDKPKN